MTYDPVDNVRIALGDDGVLRLHLDKPDKRNALDDDMVDALISSVDEAGRDEAVRAILLTAEGDHFCSGFDIVGRNSPVNEERPRVGSIQRRLPSTAHRLIPLMLSVQTPIVAEPGVVTSPRWLTASSDTSTAGRPPSARYLRRTVPRSHCVSPT